MLSFAEFLAQHKDPLYVAVNPDENTKRLIEKIQTDFNIPAPHSPSKMHCTLIFSKKPCDQPRLNPGKVYSAQFGGWDVFTQQSGKKCLVMKLDSPQLQARHTELMEQMGASYDHDVYRPHISLSYDIGDFDPSTIKTTLFNQIFFSEEYCQVLDEGYAT